jgi:hypothetical protein
VWWRFGVPAVGDEITPFNEYARSLQPPGGGEDGWPMLERLARERLGFDMLLEQPWDEDTAEPYRLMERYSAKVLTGELDDPRMREAIEGVEAFAFLLPELDAIAAADSFTFEFRAHDGAPGTIADALYQVFNLANLGRRLASLNAAHMRIAAENGDWTEAIRRLNTGVRFGQHLARTPLLLLRSIGYSGEALAWVELERLLLEATPPPEVIADLLALCDQVDEPAQLREAMLGEEFGGRGFLREYVLSERGDLDLLDPDSWHDWLDTPSYRAIERAWREFNEATYAIIDLPPAEREARRKPTPKLVLETAFMFDPYDMMVGARDGLLRARAAVKILLNLNLAIAETDVIPADPLAALPADLRVDPISGGTILVDPQPNSRFPYTLRWPVQNSMGLDRLFFERQPFEVDPQ